MQNNADFLPVRSTDVTQFIYPIMFYMVPFGLSSTTNSVTEVHAIFMVLSPKRNLRLSQFRHFSRGNAEIN